MGDGNVRGCVEGLDGRMADGRVVVVRYGVCVAGMGNVVG